MGRENTSGLNGQLSKEMWGWGQLGSLSSYVTGTVYSRYLPLKWMSSHASHQFSHGLFHLFVPQTVDEGVQHGDHHCVEDGHHFNMVR